MAGATSDQLSGYRQDWSAEKESAVPAYPHHNPTQVVSVLCDIPARRSAHSTSGELSTTSEPAFQPREMTSAPLLAYLAEMTEEEFRHKFRRSPVKRTKWRGMIRNALAALSPSTTPVEEDAERLLDHPDGVVSKQTGIALRAIRARKQDGSES